MQKQKLLAMLYDLGLTENEAKVYLSAISLGPSTILKIARNADIKRTTAYSVIESLKQRGLIFVEFKKWKKYFVAENPTRLESIIEQKKQRLEKILPEFTTLYNLKESEGIFKYYEGLESVKTIYDNILKEIKSRDDYLVISDQEQWLTLDNKYFLDFLKRRAKLNINIRMLLQDSKIAREHQKIQDTLNETIKILPTNTNLSTNLIITPNKVVIHQLTPPIMAIVIENRSIIQMHRDFFEIMWASIK